MKKFLLIMYLILLSVCSYSQNVVGNKFHFGEGTSSWQGWGSKLIINGVGDYTDEISIGKYCLGGNQTQMRFTICDDMWEDDCVVIGTDGAGDTWNGLFYFYNNGKVGLNTSTPQNELDVNGTIRAKNILVTDGNVGLGTLNPQNKLDVNGTIRAKEIKVESNWADFVFKKGYKLPTLGEVKKHIEEKGTLPGVPSESDVKVNGVNLGEVNALLLQKIEELTLYVIKQQEDINELKSQIKK